jgi:S1-C subfamily serine protease
MTDLITQFSEALEARAANAAGLVAAVRIHEGRHRTAAVWGADILVASEQALPDREEFEVLLPGGATATAKLAGRDSGTNVALLKLPQPIAYTAPPSGEAKTGAIALAFGADNHGGASVRLGAVNHVGPAWHSRRGGRIDTRIGLDISLGRFEEGGPVLDAKGARLGISTFGPRRSVIVIPSATIDRIVPVLQKDGRVARGWLGVALQPVAVPDALRDAAGQRGGLMVMSVAENGPSAKAGLLAGDILLSVNGESVRRFRRVSSHLGYDSIGREVEVKLIRSGAIATLKVTVTARPEA